MKAALSKLGLRAVLALALAAGATALAQAPKGMPSPQEMDAMMKQMQKELDKLTPEQRKLVEDGLHWPICAALISGAWSTSACAMTIKATFCR